MTGVAKRATGRVRLYRMPAGQALAALPAASVSVRITDPPYTSVGRRSGGGHLPAGEEAAMKRQLGIVASALVIAAAAVSASGGGRTVATDPAGGRYVFIDATRASEFLVDLDPSSATYGSFALAEPGVGLFRSARAASVVQQNDHSVVLQYQGAANLDTAASIDLEFGMIEGSGVTQPTSVTMQAQVNPDRVTASVTLWYGDQTCRLVSRTPPSAPSTTLTTILTDLQNQDWSGLYDLAYSGLRGSISRADFVAQNTAAWAAHGTITTISIVTPAQTTLTQAGFSTALATVDLTLTNGGTLSTVRATVSMIAEPDGWKYISIDPAQ